MSTLVADKLKHLIEAIKVLPCFSAVDCQIGVLSGGESHRCFKVTFQKNSVETSCFVKSFAEHTSTANVELEHHLLAAKAGLAPAVIYSSPLWLVCEFIDGQSLQYFSAAAQRFSIENRITVAMKLMAKMHQLKVASQHVAIDIPVLLTRQANQEYLTEHQRTILSKVINQITKFPRSNQHLVLCHGDVNEENIRLSQTFQQNLLTAKTWLVDFECSGLAEAEYDVAMYLAINQLAVSKLPKIVLSYQQSAKIALNFEKIHGYLACCYLLNGLWYVETAASREQDDGLLKKAKQQFMLFDQLKLVAESVTSLF